MNCKMILAEVALAAFATTSAAAEDSLDRRLSRISPSAVDCGSTWADAADRATVHACVTEHFLKDRPFRARFGYRCEDSDCATAIVLEPRPGFLYVVHFDSEGCKPANAHDPFCGTMVEPCRKPTLVPQEGGLKLVCKNEYFF
jgi:hypothetical protein